MESGNAAPDQLAVLLARVVRGINRLLLDPGLAPHHRVRLEIDLRFLTAQELDDRRRAGRELQRALPRIIDIVETVTPLYLRLHTDLTALLDAASELDLAEPLRLFPLPPPEAVVLRDGRPDDQVLDRPPDRSIFATDGVDRAGRAGRHVRRHGRDRPGALSDDPIPSIGSTTATLRPAGQWARHRLRFAVGVVGLVTPVEVLAAGAFATGRVGPTALALAALCPVGAFAGLVARAVVHPEQLPSEIRDRLDPPPDRMAVELHRAASDAWFAATDEPIGV